MEKYIFDFQYVFYLNFLFTDLLKKSAPSRIVNVSSLLLMIGQLDFNNMNREKDMHYWMVYSNSKLYNLIGSKEFARRLEGSGKKLQISTLKIKQVHGYF